MTEKIGRNDSCPCGSGLKYKKCCLLKKSSDSLEFSWRKQKQATQGFAARIIENWVEHYGRDAFEQELRVAWMEFCASEMRKADPSEQGMPELFMPWMLFLRPAEPDDCPPAQLYLEQQGININLTEKLRIRAILDSHLSFFEVLSIEPGRSMMFRDILTQQELVIMEQSASRMMQKGSVIFGAVSTVRQPPPQEPLNIMEISWGIQIPPSCIPDIVEFRDYVTQAIYKPARRPQKNGKDKNTKRKSASRAQNKLLSPATVKMIENHVLDLFWRFHEAILHPKAPKVVNTDGHEIVHHKLMWKLQDPQAAFRTLASLCWQTSPEEILDGCGADPSDWPQQVLDPNYKIEISIPWLRAMDHKKGKARNKNQESPTVLGLLKIRGADVESPLVFSNFSNGGPISKNSQPSKSAHSETLAEIWLEAEVNSAERAAILKQWVNKSLKNNAIWVGENIDHSDPREILQSMHQSISKGAIAARPKESRGQSRDQSMGLTRNDSISEAMENEIMEKFWIEHWKRWKNDSIPALNHMTPKQAAKTKKGQELLRALLNDYEQHAQNGTRTGAAQLDDIRRLRRELLGD